MSAEDVIREVDRVNALERLEALNDSLVDTLKKLGTTAAKSTASLEAFLKRVRFCREPFRVEKP